MNNLRNRMNISSTYVRLKTTDNVLYTTVEQDESYKVESDYCFEDHANFWTWIWLSFESKLFRIGKKRPLTISDLGASPAHMKPSYLYHKFEVEWKKECQLPESKRSLLRAFIRANGLLNTIYPMLLDSLAYVLQFLPSLILSELVTDLEQDDYLTVTRRWIYTILTFVIPIIGQLMTSHCGLVACEQGVSFRTMASEAMYRKALLLSSKAREQTNVGKLVNLMSSDTYPLIYSMIMACIVCTTPFVFIFCLSAVSIQLGKLTWIALFLYSLMVIGQLVGAVKYKNAVFKCLEVTDSRVKLMSEVLNGIRCIKYFCWEKPFKNLIGSWRTREVKLLKKIGNILAKYYDSLMALVPQIVPLICFSLYPTVMGQPLTSSVAFTCISLFKILQTPFYLIPWCLSIFSELTVSFKRITNFLNLEEHDESLVERDLPEGSTILYKDIKGDDRVLDDYDAVRDAILIRDGYFAWGDGDNCLKDISVRIPKGSLVAVVGRVGSGKTSFVSSLVGEMTKNAGVVLVNGSMSFSAQQAWLVNDTVRNNILFGKAYDETKYKEVLKVCCLEDDLKVLAGSDKCEIGERGINVSGGQKARISLARCCYSDSDIVIMDDPIAAVDSHVGKALFHSCIAKYMDGHTRILVTNATQYLHKCDYIIVLENNTISHQGTYAELKAANISIILSPYVDDETLSTTEVTDLSTPVTEPALSRSPMSSSAELLATYVSPVPTPTGCLSGVLTVEETKKTGRIPLSLFTSYFTAAGHGISLCIFVCFILVTVWSVASQFQIQRWLDDDSCEKNMEDLAGCHDHTSAAISSYFFISLLYCVFSVLRLIATVPCKINASLSMHRDLTSSVLNAPVSFFDVTPTGRLLNRFNRDISVIDNDLPTALFQLISMIFTIVAEAIVVLASTRHIIICTVLIVAAASFYHYYSLFTRPNTDFQRIEAMTMSPIFSDFQAVLYGAASIRTYGCQQRFIDGVEEKIEKNSLAATFYLWAYYWLLIRTSTVASCVNGAVAVFGNLTRNFISPGLLGAALSSSMALNNYVKDMVDMLAQTEANMSAVERVKGLIDTVQVEPPMKTNIRPPPNWPSEGRIVMNDAKLRYRDGPLVMKGVNLEIEGHEKVGVVGRTGAGKSTMMIALFRITDLCGGSVTIDGIDLATLGLEDVRRALCIIPQDPVVFSASVRFNLDPNGESNDEEIWSVLEQVELKDFVISMGGLDSDVQEGGSNFSVGERQLICMARALLRKPKILIMDEATASLDNETDTFLQQMIRKQFKQCTSLTIAHRLNTIMDADRVCVMDQGIVAEYDTPYNLLRKDGSIFQGMVVAANDPSLFDMVPGCDDMKNRCWNKL